MERKEQPRTEMKDMKPEGMFIEEVERLRSIRKRLEAERQRDDEGRPDLDQEIELIEAMEASLLKRDGKYSLN